MGKPRHEQGAATSLNHRTASPSATAGNRRQQKSGHETPAHHNGYRPIELNRYPCQVHGTHPSKTSP